MTRNLDGTLKKSAADRSAYMAKFGFVPLSILRLARGALDKSLFHIGGERGSSTGRGQRAKNLGGVYEANQALRISGGGSRNGLALSVMAGALVEFFIKYYCRPGQVYLDPFMGHGVRMQVAKRYGLHYYGYDVCREFVDYIESIKKKIDDGSTKLSTTLGDARAPDQVPDGIGDFGFTSPPYWDLEYYGDEPEQLGTGHSYSEFLASMQQVARAWLPKFKPCAWLILNVNDFRKDGRFYSYHADLIRCFVDAGWVIHDTWIIDGLVGGLPKVFAVSGNMRRVAPKVHEYALVFVKPSGTQDVPVE